MGILTVQCSHDDTFDKKEIFEYIKKFQKNEILNQTDEQIDVLLDGVKVTFFNAKWKFLTPTKIENFNLATLEAISAMKANVIFFRAKYRDYYDLYFLTKKMSLREIFNHSLEILEGLTFKLFIVSLLYIDDIADDGIDHLEPKESISKEAIRDFFQSKINRLKVNA